MARNHYSPDLIAHLVKQVLVEERPLTHVARAEGIHPGVLSKWVKREREVHQSQNTATPNDEVKALHERVHILEEHIETMRGLMEKLLTNRYR